MRKVRHLRITSRQLQSVPRFVSRHNVAGETVDFDEVLMVGSGSDVKIGAPLVEGGKVTAEVVAHGRHDKIRIVKFNRRKHHRKETGHRQWYTEVKITAISG